MRLCADYVWTPLSSALSDTTDCCEKCFTVGRGVPRAVTSLAHSIALQNLSNMNARLDE